MAPPDQFSSRRIATTDFFSRLHAIGRHWEGLLPSLITQEILSPERPVTISFEQPSSFIEEARELVTTGSRSKSVVTALRHDITDASGVTDPYPQRPRIRTSRELHMVIIVGTRGPGRHQEMAR